MYEYKYDYESGGLLLTDNLSNSSKEPRPVYAAELDILGVDAYFKYENQNEVPYMWAESNHYIYKGKNVFNIKGGSLYSKPELEMTAPKECGTFLEKVNISLMNMKNREILTIIEQVTVKKIYEIYKKYQGKLDCFHVAFSGGKDSIVLLELVKKALPKSSFMVIFGDTKMEFPDTYDVVNIVEERCKAEGVAFYRATSEFETNQSWRIFGAPADKLRWCCSVHKAAPQTLKIREILEKKDFVGLDFVGVRAHESAARASYEEENFGKKQKGQYSFNPILEWTSAEVWLYIFANDLPINETYKKGNSRAGCLFCPMGGGKSDYFRNSNYPKEIAKYTDIIKETVNDENIQSYIANGGWSQRKNGRDLLNVPIKYKEEVIGNNLVLTVDNPSTDYNEWIKTLGDLSFIYSVAKTDSGYVVTAPASIDKTTDGRYFKQVFRKAAYCIGCKVCEANCRKGCISFEEGLHISGDCIHCKQCQEIDDGCLVYHSVQLPKNGGRVMKSINSFADHAPKQEWIQDFFENGNSFFDDNRLGPMQIQMFKRFLNDSKLVEKNKVTALFELVKKIGENTADAWGILLINLTYNNPQIRWYVDNMPINESISRQNFEDKIISEGVSTKDASSITKAFNRLSLTPLGTELNFGYVSMNGRSISTLVRGKAPIIDDRVILYALYKYAEGCDGYYQFTLSTIMDTSIDSTGVSPVKIFGYDRGEMESIITGLSVKYPDFIGSTFTHDLEKISLRDYHSSADVLELF